MRKINFFQKIMKVIINCDGITKKDLAKELDFTTAGITKIVNELIELKLIKEKTYAESTGGRKPIILGLNEKKIGEILGVNLAPKSIELSISDINGKNFKSNIINIDEKMNIFVILEKNIEKLLKENPKIKIISFVLNGLVDSQNGISIFSPHYNWKNLNLKKYYEEKFNIPVVVENDVRAMALAEKIFGNCKKNKDFVVLNISEGIGCSLYINDILYYGSGFISGEIGHIVIDKNSNQRCSCGRYGCFESEISTLSLINKLKIIFPNEGHINMAWIIENIKSKNLEVLKVIDEVIKKMTIGIDMIISIINPEKIMIVGELFKEKIMLKKLIKNVGEVVLEEQKCEIIKSKFQENVGIYSAVALVNYNIFTDEKLLKKILKF